MTITVDAVYEQGVLRPVQPLALREHEKVRVTVEPSASTRAIDSVPIEPGREPIWERLAKLAASVPADQLAKLPMDGASQHDHYLYGAPKRDDLTE